MDHFEYENYIRERITSLRIKKGVSEYKMSLDLGHSKSYIANIMSKKSLPSLSEFLYICEYLEVTPELFFESIVDEPILVQKISESIRILDDKKLVAILNMLQLY